LGGEVEEEPEVAAVARRSQQLEMREVRAVHREDPVEPAEVGGLHLPRAQRRQVVAALGGVRDRAVVGGIAGVPLDRAGGVDLDVPAQAGARACRAEHGLRRRRAADVPRADEEDADRCGRCGHVPSV